MPIMLLDNKILIELGVIALHEACCCGCPDGAPCLPVVVSWEDGEEGEIREAIGFDWENGQERCLCPDYYNIADCTVGVTSMGHNPMYIPGQEAWRDAHFKFYCMSGAAAYDDGNCHYVSGTEAVRRATISATGKFVSAWGFLSPPSCGCAGLPSYYSSIVTSSDTFTSINAQAPNKGAILTGIAGDILRADGTTIAWGELR